MTQKQKDDIECIKWFIPTVFTCEITDQDIQDFLDYSEKGQNKDKVSGMPYKLDGFNALYQGKRWRGIHIHEMYEKGVLDGDMPYFVLLGGYSKTIYRKWWQFWKPKKKFVHDLMPRVVVDFLKKEMFKGKDTEIIEKCYQSILDK